MVEQLVLATLPGPIREVVIARAEGNPFFVEEVVRTLIDQGVLRRNGGWTVGEVLARPGGTGHRSSRPRGAHRPAGAGGEGGPPGCCGDRKDVLVGPCLRAGRNSGARSTPARGARLHTAPSELARSAGEREFAIKHALTREVAYESLPKAKRAHLHAQFAKWLERTGDGRRDEQAAMLAHHYAAAADPAEADLAWTGRGGRARARSRAGGVLAPARRRARRRPLRDRGRHRAPRTGGGARSPIAQRRWRSGVRSATRMLFTTTPVASRRR